MKFGQAESSCFRQIKVKVRFFPQGFRERSCNGSETASKRTKSNQIVTTKWFGAIQLPCRHKCLSFSEQPAFSESIKEDIKKDSDKDFVGLALFILIANTLHIWLIDLYIYFTYTSSGRLFLIYFLIFSTLIEDTFSLSSHLYLDAFGFRRRASAAAASWAVVIRSWNEGRGVILKLGAVRMMAIKDN